MDAPNPFVYGRPVAPPDLIDRRQEVADLLRLADGGHFARLAAPRRYGKTTLLGRLAADAERELDMTAIVVDFSRVLSIGDAAIRIEDAYRRATDGPVRRAVRELVRTWNVGLSLGAGGLAARFEANPRTDPLPVLHRLLDLPAEAHRRSGQRTLVCFDEFQELLKLGDVDGVIRSHIQHHGGAAAYLFAGSEPGMMETLFGDRERPLFGQARPVQLGPLASADVADHVEARFRGTGRDPGEALDALLELATGHPQRSMLLAHYLWEQTPPGATADFGTWGAALDAAIEPLGDGFDRFLGAIPTGEQRVLFALALSPHGLYSSYTVARFGLKPGSARDALRSLQNKGEVLAGPDGPFITDPLLRYWLRQRRRPPG